METKVEQKAKSGDITRKEFFKYHAPKYVRNYIMLGVYYAYFSTAITFLYCMINQNMWVLIDVFIGLGLALGIHLKQSRVCSVIIFLYFSVTKIIYMLSDHEINQMSMFMIAIFAVAAYYTFHFESLWKVYMKKQQTETRDVRTLEQLILDNKNDQQLDV